MLLVVGGLTATVANSITAIGWPATALMRHSGVHEAPLANPAVPCVGQSPTFEWAATVQAGT